MRLLKAAFTVLLLLLASPLFGGDNGHTTDTVLMVSPDTFCFNDQTALTNSFQDSCFVPDTANETALKEFYGMVTLLRENGIRVLTLSSPKNAVTPDAVFPNNWFSLHSQNGGTKLVTYPMLTANRRIERQVDALCEALEGEGIAACEVVDFSEYELAGKALEGTGSLVLDRANRVAYVAISPRADLEVLSAWCKTMNYHPITFTSYDDKNKPIYHTNVVMSVGEQFAVICLESITDKSEREKVVHALKATGKDIMDISRDQVFNMCGNILELKDRSGNAKIVMSQRAYKGFTSPQLKRLEEYAHIIPVNIETIETIGGGSARCMLAEVFY